MDHGLQIMGIIIITTAPSQASPAQPTWNDPLSIMNQPDYNGTYLLVQRSFHDKDKLKVMHYNGRWNSKTLYKATIIDQFTFEMNWVKCKDPWVRFGLSRSGNLIETTSPGKGRPCASVWRYAAATEEEYHNTVTADEAVAQGAPAEASETENGDEEVADSAEAEQVEVGNDPWTMSEWPAWAKP